MIAAAAAMAAARYFDVIANAGPPHAIGPNAEARDRPLDMPRIGPYYLRMKLILRTALLLLLAGVGVYVTSSRSLDAQTTPAATEKMHFHHVHLN